MTLLGESKCLTKADDRKSWACDGTPWLVHGENSGKWGWKGKLASIVEGLECQANAWLIINRE